jgi:F-box and WD-40 domain protein CDC4
MMWREKDRPFDQSSRLQIELAECVETKTVTTTTTTKRAYPPLILGPPRALQSLDAKEYPLASKSTPPGLSSFKYEVGGASVYIVEEEGPQPPVCYMADRSEQYN